MTDKEDDETLKELLDDDDIRKYFQGRDPSRAKPHPFLTEESEEQFKGKATTLKPKEVEEKEDVYGVSYTQHNKTVREIGRHFFWIGMSLAFIIAIIVTIFLEV